MPIKKIILLISLCLTLYSCKNSTDDRPIVLSTTGMIHDIVQEIGGDFIQPIGLMGPGVDPHLYKASAGDVQKISNAAVIFYNGLHLEAKLIDIFEQIAASKPSVAVTSAIPKERLLSADGFDTLYDPHVWFDVSIWISAVRVVADTLIQSFPEHATDITLNRDQYIQELVELDQWVESMIQRIPQNQRILVTAHDAFGYFGKRYGIDVIGLQGISTASEAGTFDIQQTADAIIKHQVPTIFIETSIPIRTMQSLQAAVQSKGRNVAIGTPLYTDAMGDVNTPEGSYIGMIRHNVLSICKGLQ